MRLRQGDRPIEEYVMDFLELARLTGMDEQCLMIFFRGGLSEPLSSFMPLHDPHETLEHYIDLALLLSGSSFTVGVKEKELREPGVSPQPDLHVTPAQPEKLHVTPTIKPATRSVYGRPGLISNVTDPPLMSARTAKRAARTESRSA